MGMMQKWGSIINYFLYKKHSVGLALKPLNQIL